MALPPRRKSPGPGSRLRGMFSGGGGMQGGGRQLGGRMTPVVLWLIVASAAMFVLWAFGNRPPWMILHVILTPYQFFHKFELWQPLTAMFLEPSGLSFFFSILAMWLFVPSLEQHWGGKRFLFFFLSVGVLANLVGVTLAHFYSPGMPFAGFSDATLGVVVAFGVLYGRAPVSFFGVLPMTGRQLTLVIVGISYLQLALSGNWIRMLAMTAAIAYTLLLTSVKFSPSLWYDKWKLARLRRKYKVIEGGRPVDKKRYLN